MKILPKIPDEEIQIWGALAILHERPTREFTIFREILRDTKNKTVQVLTGQKSEEKRIEGSVVLQVLADIEELLSTAPDVFDKLRKK